MHQARSGPNVRALFRPSAAVRRGALAGALVAFLLAGCSEPEVEVVEFEPGTPREAVVEFNNALGALDKAKARSWVCDGERQSEFFEVTYGMSELLSRFKRTYIEAYGEDKMHLLRNPPGAQLDYMDTHADAERLNGMIIDEQGDVAYARFADGVLMRVLRQDGQWRVDAIGTDDLSDETLNAVRANLGPQMMLAQILNEATPQIGKDGMSAEEFDLRLGRFIVNAFQNLERQAAQAVQVPGFGGAPASQPEAQAPTGHEGHNHDGHDHSAHGGAEGHESDAP